MFTPKQERNGVAIGVETHNTAVPGPDVSGEIGARIGQAMSAALSRADETVTELFATPAGAGVGGHTVGAGGDMFDWDAGLAIDEPAGEA